MKEPVQLYLRIRSADGGWTYARAATAKGRLKPLYAVVKGRAQYHEEGIYNLRYAQGGKRKWEPVGSNDTLAVVALKRKLAEVAEAEVETKDEPAAADPSNAAPEPKNTEPAREKYVRDEVTKYLGEVADRVGNDGYGAAPRTLETYTGRLQFLLEFDGVTPLSEVDADYFKRFRSHLRTRIKSDRYVYNILQATNIFFRSLGINHCSKILKESAFAPKPGKAYKDAELERFFQACTPNEELVFRFFLYSMGREREVSYTEVADLLFDESKLHIQPKPHRKFRLKGKRSGQSVRGRKVPMPRWFMEKLRVYCEGKKPGDLLFPNTEGNVQNHFLRMCKAVAKRGGLDLNEFNLHRFRKSGATMLYKSGVPVPLISKFLGHEDLRVTQMYLDITDEGTEYMVDTVSGIFPEPPKAASAAFGAAISGGAA